MSRGYVDLVQLGIVTSTAAIVGGVLLFFDNRRRPKP